jgi:hypothetical protein
VKKCVIVRSGFPGRKYRKILFGYLPESKKRLNSGLIYDTEIKIISETGKNIENQAAFRVLLRRRNMSAAGFGIHLR